MAGSWGDSILCGRYGLFPPRAAGVKRALAGSEETEGWTASQKERIAFFSNITGLLFGGATFVQLVTFQYTSSLFSFLFTVHSSSQSRLLIFLLSPSSSTSTEYVVYPGLPFPAPNLTHICLFGPTQGPSSNPGVILLGILQTLTKNILWVESVTKQEKLKAGGGGEKWGPGKMVGQLNQSVKGMYREKWMMPSSLLQASLPSFNKIHTRMFKEMVHCQMSLMHNCSNFWLFKSEEISAFWTFIFIWNYNS